MATILCLPEEVIDVILGYEDISIEDIINFRCVCKQFKCAAKHDTFMKKKFSQRWPNGKKLYDQKENEIKEYFLCRKQKKCKKHKQKNVKLFNFMEAGISVVRELHNFLLDVIKKYYNMVWIHNNMITEGTLIILQTIDNKLENNNILFNPFVDFFFSFTMDEIKSLLMRSPRRAGCDLRKRYFIIQMLAMLNRMKLYYIDPMSIDLELLTEHYAIILAKKLQLRKIVSYSSVKASLDSITYEVLKCLREKHPDHSIFSMPAKDFYYWKINVENTWNETEGTQIINSISEYILGKLNFRLNKSKELKYMCIDYIMLYLTKYSHLKSEVWKYSKSLKVTLSRKKFQVYESRQAAKFAVGTIVTHKDQSTDSSTGVIIGWHRIKDRNNVTFFKKNRRNIFDYNLMPVKVYSTFSTEQTHYLILTENDEMYYVQEDAISLTTPKWIENSEIGRYFCKFEGTHYVPNEMLAKLFPYDSAITAAAISKNPFSKIEEESALKETSAVQMQLEDNQENINIKTYITELKKHVQLRRKLRCAVHDVMIKHRPVIDVVAKYKLDIGTLLLKIDILKNKRKYLKMKIKYEAAVNDVVSKKKSINKVMKRYRVNRKRLDKEIVRYKYLGEKYQFDREIKPKCEVEFTFLEEKRFLEIFEIWAKDQLQRNSYFSTVRFLKRLSKVAYEYAKENGIKYPKSWDKHKRADISWLREFELRHSNEIRILLIYFTKAASKIKISDEQQLSSIFDKNVNPYVSSIKISNIL
ncbi:uncharacterized protein [Anoplolepis gracilipes]|uniref:uncharacterized protein isoform X2 n=1 Tax=Anoplolepis gracilipes TaxID=354296 RepID=UPI003BA0CAA3